MLPSRPHQETGGRGEISRLELGVAEQRALRQEAVRRTVH